MFRSICKFYLDKTGWKLVGEIDPGLKKFIVIIAPHTVNYDFIIGVMVRSVMNLSSTKFLGKSQLFKFPYGIVFRKLGGYPVERAKNNNMVETVIDIFNDHDEFSISLAPEGTRKKVDRLKTGFYHIARRAQVPILMVGLDFGTKTIVFREPFYPTNDAVADFTEIIGFFSAFKGKIPEQGIDMAMLDRMRESLEQTEF